MLLSWSLFLAFLLPCVGMSAVFLVYICLLWYASARSMVDYNSSSAASTTTVSKPKVVKGLTPFELQKLPSVVAGEEESGKDCAVCIDEIEFGQITRLIPGCNHGFHLQCADAWLSKNPVCPICRTKLDDHHFPPPLPPPSTVNSSAENLC